MASSAAETDQVCRDFLRDCCRRGTNCRYKHPSDNDQTITRGIDEPTVEFCRDFQTRGCMRQNCRFVHGMRAVAAEIVGPDLEVPVCKDYLKRQCERGRDCKFRHLSIHEYERDVERKMKRKAQQSWGGVDMVNRQPGWGGVEVGRQPGWGSVDVGRQPGWGGVDVGRQPGWGGVDVGRQPGWGGVDLVNRQQSWGGVDMVKRQCMQLIGGNRQAENETAFLRSRLADVEQQIDALKTSNTLLMQQNNRLRSSVSGGGNKMM